MTNPAITFQVRARPGASSTHIGGTWGDADGPLNVWVTKRAVDGAANDAIIEALATALKVRKRQLSIVSGHKARTKTLRVDDPPADLAATLDAWRAKDGG